MFVRLTCALTNRPLYLNPAHVVAVHPWRDSRGDDPEYTAVAMTDDAGAPPGQSVRRVLEPIDEVVARLSSGEFDTALAPPAPAAAAAPEPASAPADSKLSAEDRRAAGAALAEHFATSSDYNLLGELYGIDPATPTFGRIPAPVVVLACEYYEKVGETHPDAETRHSHAARARSFRAALAARRAP